MFFKKKKENLDICNNIYNNTLIITERLKKIIASYGYIPKNKGLFVSISSLYCYFFFELTLKKYYNFDEKRCFIIIYSLIIELTSHLKNVTMEQTFNVYLEIKKILENPPKVQKEEYVSLNYLIMSINFNEEEIETFLLFDIYQEFNTILNNAYKLK